MFFNFVFLFNIININIACDPFSKKKGNDPKSLLYDEPPEEYEQRQKRKLSKLKKQFQEVETLDTPIDSSFLPPQESTVSSLNDKLLQQQAKRELQIQNSVYLSSSHNLSKSNGNVSKTRKITSTLIFLFTSRRSQK